VCALMDLFKSTIAPVTSRRDALAAELQTALQRRAPLDGSAGGGGGDGEAEAALGEVERCVAEYALRAAAFGLALWGGVLTPVQVRGQGQQLRGHGCSARLPPSGASFSSPCYQFLPGPRILVSPHTSLLAAHHPGRQLRGGVLPPRAHPAGYRHWHQSLAVRPAAAGQRQRRHQARPRVWERRHGRLVACGVILSEARP
jgi:hypothetical protein